MLKDAHVSHVNGMMAAFGAFIIIGGLLAGWLSDLLGSRSVMLSILFFIRLLSLICLLIPITTGIVQFFVVFFIDRFSVRKIMALGAVCISASFLVLPYSPNVHVFSAIYGVLGGIGYSCAVGVTTQYFISRWFDTHKGLALAILTNANSS